VLKNNNKKARERSKISNFDNHIEVTLLYYYTKGDSDPMDLADFNISKTFLSRPEGAL
jgi:poly-D-alanine transfer protein DltD